MDERKEYYMRASERPNYPFGANHAILPVNETTSQEVERLFAEMDDRSKELSDKHPEEGRPKFAILCSIFSCDRERGIFIKPEALQKSHHGRDGVAWLSCGTVDP